MKFLVMIVDVFYIGQTTGRQLIIKSNLWTHRNHINRNTISHFVITEHRIDYNHDFNWNDVKIIDMEHFLEKRLISEMLSIKKTNKYP